jgi:hypothetical protein
MDNSKDVEEAWKSEKNSQGENLRRPLHEFI